MRSDHDPVPGHGFAGGGFALRRWLAFACLLALAEFVYLAGWQDQLSPAVKDG